MKAMSVLQPFAGLIGIGNKTLETRTRQIHYRGDLLICSSAKLHSAYLLACDEDRLAEKFWSDQVKFLPAGPSRDMYGLGQMLCVVEVVGCHAMTEADEPAAWCRVYPGAYCWEFANIRPVEHLPVTGNRGFYEIDDSLIKYL